MRWAARVAGGVRGAARLRAVRHRAGRRASPTCARRSVAALPEIGFEGYAIGGLAVGEGQAAMLASLDATVPLLPPDRPRYLMGVGTPDDLLAARAARDRHVRLRDADPRRPHRARLHRAAAC